MFPTSDSQHQPQTPLSKIEDHMQTASGISGDLFDDNFDIHIDQYM